MTVRSMPVAFGLALSVLAGAPALAQQAPSPQVLAAVDASRGADLAGLRSRAWRDDAGAQMSLAMRLGDAHRRGADESSMVEAAYWAGRAWQAPVPASPAALAAFVSANCGSATIASHWVCTEAE
jgi:hypothetical protein